MWLPHHTTSAGLLVVLACKVLGVRHSTVLVAQLSQAMRRNPPPPPSSSFFHRVCLGPGGCSAEKGQVLVLAWGQGLFLSTRSWIPVPWTCAWRSEKHKHMEEAGEASWINSEFTNLCLWPVISWSFKGLSQGSFIVLYFVHLFLNILFSNPGQGVPVLQVLWNRNQNEGRKTHQRWDSKETVFLYHFKARNKVYNLLLQKQCMLTHLWPTLHCHYFRVYNCILVILKPTSFHLTIICHYFSTVCFND